jgi:DNA-binding beta-propeller fold protein YncE
VTMIGKCSTRRASGKALGSARTRPLLTLMKLLLPVLFLLAACQNASGSTQTHVSTVPTQSDHTIHHDMYTFSDGEMNVYDMDHGQAFMQRLSLPLVKSVRGVVANPATHLLYVAYGGDGGDTGNGSLLAYNLLTNAVVWRQHYAHGIDSMAISPDGMTIFMPDGGRSADGIWYIVDARTGQETGNIQGGANPHNTIVGLSGKHVYLGGEGYNYLEVADTATHRVVQRIGPLRSGVRPFTINGRETLAYISVTGFLGFQVGDITTGKVLYTVPVHGFTWAVDSGFDPSHGISLSPDEKMLYLIDYPNSYVHVFDVSQVPAQAPRQIADIPLTRSMHHQEMPCSYDCTAEGWLLNSRDGRYVYVGDAGDVIDTATHKVIANIDTLYMTRKMIEIDWQNGVPVFTTNRFGIGYVTG